VRREDVHAVKADFREQTGCQCVVLHLADGDEEAEAVLARAYPGPVWADYGVDGARLSNESVSLV
jgi:hypothetical protein